MTKLPNIYLTFQKNLCYYKRTKSLQVQCLLLVVMLITFVVLMISAPIFHIPPVYFWTGADARPLVQPSFTEPLVSNNTILKTAELTALYLSSFTFQNYNTKFDNIREDLPVAPVALTDYMNALEFSRNLVTIELKKMIVTSKLNSKPTIVSQGVIDLDQPRYVWVVSVPIKQMLLSTMQKTAFVLNQIWTVKLARIDINGDYPKGFAIYNVAAAREN